MLIYPRVPISGDGTDRTWICWAKLFDPSSFKKTLKERSLFWIDISQLASQLCNWMIIPGKGRWNVLDCMFFTNETTNHPHFNRHGWFFNPLTLEVYGFIAAESLGTYFLDPCPNYTETSVGRYPIIINHSYQVASSYLWWILIISYITYHISHIIYHISYINYHI